MTKVLTKKRSNLSKDTVKDYLTALLESIRELEELKSKFYRKSRVDLDEPEHRDEQ